MKCSVLIGATLLLMATCASRGLCEETSAQRGEQLVLQRNRRTVQHFVEYFANIFRLSAGGSGGPKKAHSKQDHASPLTSVLKASGSKFSGFSGTKQREPTLQHDLPTWIDDNLPEKLANPYSEALEADALEPTRVSLLSTTHEPEETTQLASTTMAAPPTTTIIPEPMPPAAQPTELPAEPAGAAAAPGAGAAPEATPALSGAENTSGDSIDTLNTTSDTPAPVEQPASSGASTEATDDIDPAAVNGLSSQYEVREGGFRPTPIPLVSYQHYVQPATVWQAQPAYQNAYPMTQYFGNNVFYPGHAQFPLAAPFQPQQQAQAPHQVVHQTHHHQQHHHPHQGYLSQQPLYDNRLHYPTAPVGGQSYQDQSKSQSRVKLHNNQYDLVTYHDDTEPAAANYQSQSFGNGYQTHEY